MQCSAREQAVHIVYLNISEYVWSAREQAMGPPKSWPLLMMQADYKADGNSNIQCVVHAYACIMKDRKSVV